MNVPESVLLLVLTGAVILDLATDRISNGYLLAAFITGSIYRIWFYGILSSLTAYLQILIVVFALFLLFHMRALGAGDIKLLSITTIYLTGEKFRMLFVLSFLVGAAWSLGKLWYQKNLWYRVFFFTSYVRDCIATGKMGIYDWNSDGLDNRIHFSVAILIGYLVCLGVVN